MVSPELGVATESELASELVEGMLGIVGDTISAAALTTRHASPYGK